MKDGIAGFLTKTLALSICFIFAGTGGALAEITLPEYSGELGAEVSYIKYEEPDVMEETGMMYGIVGSIAYHKAIMLKADGKWSWGTVDYDGALNDGTAYTVNNIDDYMLEFRGLAGYDFSVSETMMITPYVGFGYRYLNDGLDKDVAGYERESNYYYSPIGVEVIKELTKGWSIGGTVEYDYFWKGVQKSHLEDLSASLNTLENDQEEGYGVRGSIKILKEGKDNDYLVEPFIRYWNIKQSNINDGGFEPKNNSFEIGGKFVVVF